MKLYVVSPDCAPKDQCLRINGMGCGLLEQDIQPTPNEPADFLCISYSWGRSPPSHNAQHAARSGSTPSAYHPHLDILEAEELDHARLDPSTKKPSTAHRLRITITCATSPPAGRVLVESMQLFSRLGYALALLLATTPEERKKRYYYPWLTLSRTSCYEHRVKERTQTWPDDDHSLLCDDGRPISTEPPASWAAAAAAEPRGVSSSSSACKALMALCERKEDWSFV
ncbi:hypothetical protein C8A03DRAFT_36731 [Achaetomium macrosporum]|uniref:Uncharacterized protein n=1 Tax=Achaetomium macrosporum TaxID=79813 RepID=A0AAN7C4U0_9PEZI|nr:hypothetical protein C8A03DRAFT_36731 [Achaetomium macrosporum]